MTKSKNNSIYNSTANEILEAVLEYDSCISIELQPGLFRQTAEDITKTTKTKVSTNAPFETNHSLKQQPKLLTEKENLE